MKRIALLFLFTILSAFLFAQKETSYSLNTPRACVYTHLYFLQDDSYRPEIAAKTINLKDKKQAKDLSIHLKQFLDAKGLFVDMDMIPDEENYVDSLTKLHRFPLFADHPEIYVEKVGANWYYSKKTVAAIPAMHEEMFPFGTDELLKLMPKQGHKKILGLYSWQYVGILALIVITLILYWLFAAIIRFIIRRLSDKTSLSDEQVALIKRIASAMSWLLMTIVVEIFVPALQLPISVSKYVILILDALTPVFGIIAVFRAIELFSIYFAKRAEATESTLDDQLIPLLSKALKIVAFITGAIFILSALGVDVTTLLAGLSIGGLAFALAAQDTIKNLFGSVMIFIDKPFQVGDWINFDGIDGTVEEVGFRSTRVRTFANSMVYVPNGKIADMTVDNLGLRAYRRYKAMVGLTYDTPPDLIDKFVKGLREIVKNHPKTRKDYFEIHLNDMGANSLNILFYIFFEVPDWSKELSARHEIILETLRLAEDLGVRFAFPTQTIHIEEMPERKSLSPVYDDNNDVIDAKLEKFMEGFKTRYNKE